MNHLVYVTFGEVKTSVYQTQVIKLLNKFSEKTNWKISLVQISDKPVFYDLNSEIAKIHIKRRNKIPIFSDFNKYSLDIHSRLKTSKEDKLYFNSRGYFAYKVITNFINKYRVDNEKNNLDVRGISEELKTSIKGSLLYFVIDFYFRRVYKNATSVTCVSSELKEYLKKKYENERNVNISVIPTSSIMSYENTSSNYDNIVFIGNVLWVSKDDFISNIYRVIDSIKPNKWKIDIIGSREKILELPHEYTCYKDRIAPDELSEEIRKYYAGLIIRDNSLINKVSAPCKVSDYLCMGMPVVYSGEIGSLNDFIDENIDIKKCVISVDELSNDEQKRDRFLRISNSERELLSLSALRYFGIDAVVEKYIKIFTSS